MSELDTSTYTVRFDASNKHWLRSMADNRNFLLSSQNYLNHLLYSQGFVFLNDVYHMLGFKRFPEGQLVGWFKEKGSSSIDFGMVEEDAAFVLKFHPDGIIYHKL
jgi:hypothetical protein